MSIFINPYFTKNFRLIYIGLIIIAIFALLFAYFIEQTTELSLCPLWIYAKLPYFTLIKLSITGLVIKKLSKYTVILIMLTLFCASILALYHSSIERGFCKPSKLSTTFIHTPDHLSIEDIKKIFKSRISTLSCNNAPLKMLSLSLVEWNLLLNLSLLISIVWLRRLTL